MPLKLFIRDGRYHYRGTVAGRRLRGSTGTSDKATAQRIAAEKEARQWKGHLDGPEAVLTFAQAAMLYRTAEKSTRFLDPVENYWKDTAVRLIIAGTIKQSAIVLLPNASGATRNRQVIVPTQAIINHAAGQGLCRRISVERFPVMRVEKDYATWEWIEAFMAEASPHLGALACFMFLTGARISEALAVTWEDVDLHGRRARIRQTKIGAERWAHLPWPLVAAIANIPDRKEAVFKYSSRDTAAPSWDLVVGRAKIKPLSFHACRHGFATAMLHAGVDPITTAKRGGWKDAHHLFRTYGHAMDDETVTDRIIATNLTRTSAPNSIFSLSKGRKT
jgi:integrase